MASSAQDTGPYLFEDLHRRTREIRPTSFDGIRLNFHRPLSPHLQLTHSMSLGLLQSSYRFGANYMGTKQVSPMESYPIVVTEMSVDGSLTAQVIHQIDPRLRAKLLGSFQKRQCASAQATLDYKGDNFTSTVSAANIDLIRNSGILVGQSLHSVTNSISIGPELVFQYDLQNPKRQAMSQLSLGGRYKAEDFLVDASLSVGGAHISFYQKGNEDLHFGAEFMADLTMKQVNAEFFYQYEIKKSQTLFRGGLDSAWNVSAVLEKRFNPLPIALMMSAVLNHPKCSTTVGIGLSIGQG